MTDDTLHAALIRGGLDAAHHHLRNRDTTTHKWDFQNMAVRWITCEYCGAPPCTECRTSGGRFTTPHSARTWPFSHMFRHGWGAGFEAGIGEGKRRAARS